ncbi:FAD-binding oxidoreductase [Nocardia pseudobrasiliensis]|uniref:FAD-binding oxidoreductase n=1 Tax=Nocardia pseudobrasiliensis TaxID=45979 RepID=UPI001472262A|nr:FAD-binding oxidoreductase [Nocardia pseudobrasiliensis]
MARADAIDDRAWDDLRRRLRGTVVSPGDSEFDSAKAVFEPRFDESAPLGVVRAADAADVRSAVVFARDHELPVAVRAGGHSYVGASATSGALVIDLRALSTVARHGDLVTVGAGTTITAVQQALAPSGVTLALGTCPTVGVAGLTLGGGLGVESRRYGLSCDRLVSADLVLPNGSAATVSQDRFPGLFWALRGAGGVIGIVTSLTLRTIPAVAKDIVRVRFPGAAATQVLTGWARWMPAADRTVWANIQISTATDGLDCAALIVCPPGRGEAATAELSTAATVAPLSVDRRTLAPSAAAADLGGGARTPRSNKAAGSDVLTELSPAAAQTITDLVAARSRSGATGYVLIDPLDGAIHDTPPDATAFPWRTHAATLQWLADNPADPRAARAWIADAHRAVASTGGYVNYLEPDDDPRRYYGPNLNLLRTLRATVDPGRRLRPGLAV